MVTGAYKTHLFVLKLELGAHDAAPSEYAKHIHVEYTLANSLVSRAQVRSISLSGQYYEEPPDRWVRQTRGTVSQHYEEPPDLWVRQTRGTVSQHREEPPDRWVRQTRGTVSQHYEEPPDRWVRHVVL